MASSGARLLRAEGAKAIGNIKQEALRQGAGLISDAMANKAPITELIKERTTAGINNLQSRLEDRVAKMNQTGSGIYRGRKRRISHYRKRRGTTNKVDTKRKRKRRITRSGTRKQIVRRKGTSLGSSKRIRRRRVGRKRKNIRYLDIFG